MDELRDQTAAVLAGGEVRSKEIVHPIAFNLVPAIDSFLDDGYTKEELKVTNESRKILGDEGLMVTATAVRVPVMICHSEAVNVEFDRPVSPAAARAALEAAAGIMSPRDAFPAVARRWVRRSERGNCGAA